MSTEKEKLKESCDKVLVARTYWLLSQETGLVKIGKSRCPIARMRDLRTMNAATVEPLLVHRAEESELHARFSHLRKHGEWFTIHSDMVSYLRQVKENVAADRLEQVIDQGRPV